MPTFVWVVLGTLTILLVLFVLGWMNAIRASAARERRLDEMIRPAMEAVAENRPSALDLVTRLAETPAARNHLFARLRDVGKSDIFPVSFRSIDKVAESDLARWLMHQNELGAAPSEMELIRTIAVGGDSKIGSLMLFRFRTDPPHWASKSGWMAGVAGPYWDGDEPPDFAQATFSELTPFDRLTVEQHLTLLSEAVKKKGLVVRS